MKNRKKKQEKRYWMLFLFIGFIGFAQTKGVVKDSLSGNAIPYVSVWVENENIGTTSEENGEFIINVSDKSKNLIFSALGFEKKIVSIENSKKVLLKPKAIDLNEIVVSNKIQTNTITVGDYSKKEIKAGVSNLAQENVHIWGKIIHSNEAIEKHPFLKTIEFHTRSQVKNALLRIRFFALDNNQNPIGDIVSENILVSVKKGKNKNSIDLSMYNIQVPKEGMIVGFEYLKLEQNRYNFQYTNQNSSEVLQGSKYEPAILGSFSDKNEAVILNGSGAFNNLSKKSPVDIALKLTLTN